MVKHRLDDAPAVDLVVRRLGVVGLPDWTDEHEAELRRGNALWNKLVELDRVANADFSAVTASDPQERQAQLTVDGLRERRDALLGERADERRDTRSRSYSDNVRAEITQIEAEIKIELAALRKIQKELRALPENAERIVAIELARRAAVKSAVHASDVYWATAEAIRKGYETARSAVLKRRGQGLPAQLNFHRYDGGRFVNQFTNGGKNLVQFRRDHRDRDLLQLTGYATYPPGRIETRRMRNGKEEIVMRRPPGGQTYPVTVKINEHRGLPVIDGLRVKEASIVLRRWPDYHAFMPAYRSPWLARESRVIITATAPEGSTREMVPGREVVSVNLGWRKLESGDLRVAMVLGQDGREIVFGDRLTELPRMWLALAERIEQQKSERDTLRDKIAVRLKALPWDEAPETIKEWGSNLAKAPKFGQRSLARLVLEWSGPHAAPHPSAAWLPDDLAAFEVWRKADNRLRSNEEAARRRFLGGRLDQYRRLAKLIAERATVILLDQVDFSQMKKKRKGEDDALEPAARRQGQLAAVGELAQCIRNAAARYGREVIEDPGPSTFVCSVCDRQNKPLHRERLEFRCDGCGTVHDQDVNNCRVRLRRYLASAPDPTTTPAPLAAE